MERQWVAYRAVPRAMLAAPLPSAPELGGGWRGVDLRRIHPREQFDRLVEETGAKSEAALGVWVREADVYAIGAALDAGTVRLVIPTNGSTPKGSKAQAKAFARWSREMPSAVTAEAVLSTFALRQPAALADALAGLLGITSPIEPIPDPLDLQAVARTQLGADTDTLPRRRRFARWG